MEGFGSEWGLGAYWGFGCRVTLRGRRFNFLREGYRRQAPLVVQPDTRDPAWTLSAYQHAAARQPPAAPRRLPSCGHHPGLLGGVYHELGALVRICYALNNFSYLICCATPLSSEEPLALARRYLYVPNRLGRGGGACLVANPFLAASQARVELFGPHLSGETYFSLV